MILDTAIGVQRTLDGRRLTAIANHPDVRPWLGGGDEPIDMVPLVENPGNLTFETASGGVLCVGLGAGRYDVHSMFLPDGRGAEALDAMTAVADYMFTTTDCIEGRTTVPMLNRAALVAARRAGFEQRYTSQIPWGTSYVEAEFYALSLERWALRSPLTLRWGQDFHVRLEAAKHAAGSARVVHADDPVHDHIVGATALMAQRGLVNKAVNFYNVWATCGTYAPIQLLRVLPTILDVQDAIIEVTATGMEVLKCR